MSDTVLEDLRQHVIKGKEVQIDGDEIIFLDVNGKEMKRVSKHTLTPYHSKSTKKPYDLLAVYTCYKYSSLQFSEYVTKCRKEKAGILSTVDKKELIAYLKGDIDTLGSMDQTSVPTTKKTSRDENTSDKSFSPDKKRKLSKDSAIPIRQKDKENVQMINENTKSSTDDDVMKRIYAREITYRTRTTILNANMKTKPFDSILKLVDQVNIEAKEKMEKASKASLLAPVSLRREQVKLSQLINDKIAGTPIIVVPAGFSDLFTMLNCREFLEEGVFIPTVTKKSQGARKQQSFEIEHEENGEKFKFKIVDSVGRFIDRDWKRVVGVIVSGHAWQFKGWRFKFPLELFKKVCGIYIYNQGSQMNEEIKQWDVKVLMIHPDKRHLDKVAAKEFWRHLLDFIRVRLQ